MLTESQATAAATAAFREKLPDAEVREVYAFTVDNGLTWTVHFRRPELVEANEETGIVTTTIESNDSWILCVDSETSRVHWVETL